MPRRFHRAAPSLSILMNREIARAYRAVGLAPPIRPRTVQPRAKRPRPLELVEAPPPPPLPAPVRSPEQDAYLRRFPTLPAWFANLEPGDLITDLDTSNFPCMADAEDGEQPWDCVPFPFVGPPDDALVD